LYKVVQIHEGLAVQYTLAGHHPQNRLGGCYCYFLYYFYYLLLYFYIINSSSTKPLCCKMQLKRCAENPKPVMTVIIIIIIIIIICRTNLQNLFGGEPYSGRTSSIKQSCSKTEFKRRGL